MASRRNQESGTLVLSVDVDANGNPTKVEVSRSSGHNRLDEAAKSWMSTCKFKAPIVEGRPVAGKVSQPYTFNLRD
jgi:protein TonB